MAKQTIQTTDNLPTGRTVINSNFTELYDRIIYPEDFNAVGDGIADDTTALTDYFAALSSGANKYVGSSRKATYMVSAAITVTGAPIFSFHGTIKRTTASTQTEILILALGTAGIVDLSVNVDGNSANANPVTGILINSGSNNKKSEFKLAAHECDIGVQIIGNVEKLRVNAHVSSCIVGVNVSNDGSPATPDEIAIVMTGSDCDTFFLADGTEKVSGSVNFDVEQGDNNTTYAIDHKNGIWTYTGEIRGVHGGVSISTTAALAAKFDLVLLGRTANGSDLNAMLVDSGTCALSGSLLLPEWKEGVWIKACATASLQLLRRDSGSTGIGLRLGDNAGGKTVNGFTLLPGSALFGVTGLYLDKALYCVIDIGSIVDNGSGITISAQSSSNDILLPNFERATVITNNRTENDNNVTYKGSLTNAELELIPSPFKGMFVRSSADSSVYGGLFRGAANWQSQDGKSYDVGSHSWS